MLDPHLVVVYLIYIKISLRLGPKIYNDLPGALINPNRRALLEILEERTIEIINGNIQVNVDPNTGLFTVIRVQDAKVNNNYNLYDNHPSDYYCSYNDHYDDPQYLFDLN